jgi:hypothetical protein
LIVPFCKAVVVIESGAVFTVSVAVPMTPGCDAEIVEAPAATPVAKPVELIVATVVLDDAHVAWFVRF